MTSPQNLDFALAGPVAGLPLGFNLYGKRVGSPTFAAFAARARAPLASANDLSVAPWTFVGLTLAAGTETAPDGSLADAVYETAANTEHRATITCSGGTALAAGQYTFGAYVKPVGTTLHGGASYEGTGTGAAFIDLATGRLLAQPAPASELTKVSGQVVDVGGGWLRLSIVFEVGAGAPASADLSLRPGSALGAYLGDIGRGLAVWGAHLSQGAQYGFEDFEQGWSGSENYALTIATQETARFDTGLIVAPQYDFEDFEHGWLNYPFSAHELIELAIFNEGGAPVVFEDFEHGWPDYAQALDPTIITQVEALFDPGASTSESFEASWNNDTYSPTIITQTAATFGLTPDAFESFEDVVLDTLVVVLSDVVLSAPAHGLTNGTTGYLQPQVGGVQIANTYANVKYYVIDGEADPDVLSLSLTEGGGPVTFLDGGVGDQFFKGDPERYWTSADGDPLI